MVSLGCPKNTVDGEVLLGDLFRSGFDIIDAAEDADAIVINTCGFVEDAKTESIDTIIQAARLKAEGKVKRVVITGCLAQRYSDELAEQLPEADLVVGFQNYENLAGSLREVLGAPPSIDLDEYSRRSRVQVGEATVGFRPEWDRFRLTPQHTAYLRVAEGCNHACTFCAIPGFR
jgi:ribosomal protein S12 methylthiotransferase